MSKLFLRSRGLFFFALFSFTVCFSQQKVLAGDTKPFKILTSGKQINIKSKTIIKNVMVWTASGHRIVEQQNINDRSYQFKITVPQKIFFLMVQMSDGKTYSEKIGVQ